jgi:hypothetical protein
MPGGSVYIIEIEGYVVSLQIVAVVYQDDIFIVSSGRTDYRRDFGQGVRLDAVVQIILAEIASVDVAGDININQVVAVLDPVAG